MNTPQQIYKLLLKEFQPQGWWPIINEHTLVCEYNTNAPKNEAEVFEICIGALLTQNSQWFPNVVRAIQQLKKLDAVALKTLVKLSDDKLKEAIRSAGYFNQKAKKLRIFTKFCASMQGRIPSRDELLNLWGVGNETADSMLLYAFKVPIFVVDTYTKRIFSRIGLCAKDVSYDELQHLFHQNLKKDVVLFNEYHALIAELAKRNCTKSSPKCESWPIKKLCKKCV